MALGSVFLDKALAQARQLKMLMTMQKLNIIELNNKTIALVGGRVCIKRFADQWRYENGKPICWHDLKVIIDHDYKNCECLRNSASYRLHRYV